MLDNLPSKSGACANARLDQFFWAGIPSQISNTFETADLSQNEWMALSEINSEHKNGNNVR
jgi:hypothetical protein